MNLIELLDASRRRSASLAAQTASASTAAPDLIGRAVESQPMTGVAPSTVIQDPGGFQRLYQEQRNAGALMSGPLTTDWMNEAPENASLVQDEVPRIVDWELTAERLVRDATGSNNIEAAARSWWLGMRSMGPALQLSSQQPRLEQSVDYLGTLRALEDQITEGRIPNYELLATSDGRNTNTSILQLQRYAAMDGEQRAAERNRVAQQIAGSEESIGYLRDVLRDYSESQGLLAAGRTVNFTDIRDFRSLAEWASFTGTQAVIDAGSALAIGTGGFLVGGPLGSGSAVFTYGSLRGFTGITAEQAIRDAPYTTEEIARASLFGTLSGSLEIVLGPAARFTRGVAGRTLTREAYSEVTQEVLGRVSQGYLRRIGREVGASSVEEFFQEGAQYFLQRAGVEGEDFRWTDTTLLEAFNASMAGLVGGGVIGGGMGARQQIVIERMSRELRDAGQTVQNMEELANVTQDLALAQRSPTKFQQLAQRLGLNRVPVFYQADDLNTYFQSQNKDPVTEVVRLGGTAEDFEAALASGGRVAVTAEGLARAGLRGTDGDFLTESGSFTPAGSTPAEAKAVEQTYNEIQQQIQEQSRMAEMAPERRQVYDAIYSQLRSAGRPEREAEANAALSTAFFETMAARYGEDSGLDLYRRFGFRVEGTRQMARAEAAAEAAQLQIPDEVVNTITDAVAQAQDGGPVTIPMSPEVNLAMRTLGVPIDANGTISPEDVQRLTAAIQALEAVVPRQTIGRLFEQSRLVDEKNRVAELRRSVGELRAFAEQQSSWRDWYDTYQSMLEDMFGQDADMFRQILAATSQAASVPANVGLAVKAYEQMLSGQPFTGYLPAVIKNLDRIRAEVALSGQKIGQYGAAVTGDEDGIAIDRHVAMIMFDTKSPTAAQVELGKQTVRDIAAQLGWKPREVQAALWAANIARAGKEPQSYDAYLIRKADQIRAIREAFPAPDAGRGDTGAGAGGAVDPGAAEGRTFEQGPVSTPDTSVAGGLTEKSFIKTRSLQGATIFPMFADLTDAGSVFDTLDGLPVAPTPYLGGPNFPWLKAYRDAGIVWAFNKAGVITRVRNKVRALQEQARAEGRSDRVVITMLAMKEDAHTSNEMTINALLRTLDAVVEAGRFPPEQLAKAKDLITSKSGKADDGYGELATFPGFGDAQALHDWIRGATFTGRKALATEMRSAAFQQLPGMFPVERIVREAVDPDYRATQQGDALLAFEIDPDAEDLIIDFDDPEQAGDVPRHPAYRYGMRGTLVGSFSTHIPMEVLYGDLLPAVIGRAKPGSSPKFLMERLKTEDGQIVTDEIIRNAEVIEGLHDYRIAQAYTAGIAGQWRSSDDAANKGGINPVEFERALIENNAAATLTKYTRDDLKAGKKDGSLRAFQLGAQRVQDGGLNVWMAVKTGLDYREEYPGDVTSALVEQGILTDNETALVGVASNELGVNGMATFQVLKGVEEGVTVLDAFKVRSASKPDGLLPAIYATLGFEEVGEIQFDPQYFDDQQLADLKAIWSRQGWDEADGYPAVAIMKWRGSEDARANATQRFIAQGQDGLGIGRGPDLSEFIAEAAGIFAGDAAGGRGDGVTGAGDGRADPRSYADRARGVSGRARDFVDNLLAADQRAIDALKLPQDLVDTIRSAYGQGRTLEQRPEGAEPRGSITFPGGGLDSGQSVIRLFERADRSTFAHEAGHFFLEAFKQLATDPQAPAGMIDDFRTINEYLGRDPEDTSEYTVDQQETWARSFEAYIMEGKAPSIALRSAFERFKAWLTRIYRQAVNLQVELSPEIREVMDRMLATEEEIALVKAEQEIAPLFLERPTGMDAGDYDRYRRTATEADDEASQRLMNKLMARIRLQRQKTYNAERKALTATVSEELSQTRTYQTITRLQTGETRLNRQQIVDQFGDEALRELSRESLGGKFAIYAKGGKDLSVMAELMGYDSEVELIDDLRAAQKFSITVELEVNKRLDQKYGDLLTDGSIKDAARAAMHSDKRGQLLTAEANQLRAEIEAAGGPTPPNLSREAIKQQARDMIQDLTVRQAANPNVFLRAERKAAGEAQRAFSRVARAPSGRMETTGAQDLIAAHAAKRRQLLNHYLYIEARKAEELVAKMRKQSTRLQKKSTREAVASPYIDEIYALLEQYDFRQLSPGQLAKQQSLAAFVEAMRAAGREGELSIDERLIKRAERTHFSTLTVDELQGLKDTLDNLEHLGRTKMKLLDAKRQRDYAQVQQSMLRAMDQNLTDQPPALVQRDADARKRAGRIALNTVLSADAIINRLDGSVQGVGDVWRAIKEPINEGLARVQVRKQQATTDFADLFKQFYSDKERRDLNSKMLSVPEVGQSLPKQAILAIALNTGNRDNFERLTNPNNEHSIPRDRVDSILSTHLDERDWRFVQAVWDYIDSYWPEISAQERALTGVNPKKVDARPQITPHAFVKGGYFPIRYDPRLSGAVQDYDHNQMMENLKGGRFAKAQTRNGHTKERVSSTGQPLRLDLGIAIAHVNDVIYDLEMRQPVQNTWRLLNDPQIDAMFKRKNASEDAEALKLWVQDVANSDRWSGSGWSAAYRHMRAGLSIAKMGFSITTLVQQPTGLLQSAVVVGKGPLAKALWKYKNNPMRNAAAVRAMSPFMEERQQTFQRDLAVLTEGMAEDPTFSRYNTFKQVMSAAAFYLIQKSQYYIVDVPTWMAAYDTELRKNGGDADSAARVADQIVARAQGSGLLSDRTAFERGTLGKDTRNVELARLMTTFGSYMMAKFSVATQRVRGTDLKNPAEFVSLLVDLLMLYTIETAVAVFLTGNWPDFEDEEEDPLLLFLAKETGLSIMSGLPIAREAASTLEGFGGGGTLAAAIEEGSGLVTGVYRMGEIAAGLEDPDRARSTIKDVIGGVGVMFHLPTIQIERTVNGMFDDDMQFRDDFTVMDLLLGRRGE